MSADPCSDTGVTIRPAVRCCHGGSLLATPGTLCVAGSFVVRSMPAVEMLIVDEAAQATEPETLIALLLLLLLLLLAAET